MRANIKVYGNNADEVIANWKAEADRFFGIKPYEPVYGTYEIDDSYVEPTWAAYDLSVVELAGDDPEAGGARYRATLRTFELSNRDGVTHPTGKNALKLHLGRVEFDSVKDFNEAVKAEATSFYGDWPYIPTSDAEPLGGGRYAMDVTLVTEDYVRKYGWQ
ncbi:hypothetical protein ACLQ2P_11515 [Actinomadura citrea]|uniref:hypothetical protein n=1 Tax=Actinomadura citrea TaxID=46158 RepID=UPI003CE4FA83